nr:MAG TPA: hypothetical protein [Caudoviricetes sp.]
MMPFEDFSLKGIIFLQQAEQGQQGSLYFLTRIKGLLPIIISPFSYIHTVVTLVPVSGGHA